MGLTRLVLALGVLLSHTGMRVVGLNPGVIAVVGFYLISGYVMTGLVQRHFRAPARVPAFYLDRVLRLYPQYLFYAGVTLLWFVASGRHTSFLTHAPGLVDLARNLALVPLNFYMFNGADSFTLIPPAWSLGAEVQFYLLVPFMVLWPPLAVVLGVASLAVHAAALLGILHTDWYGYRLLPGVLWIFGAGMLMFRLQRAHPGRARRVALLAPLAALAIFTLLHLRGLDAQPYHREVLLGWGLGIPLLYGISQRRSGWFDTLAGDLSYGVFLNHFLLIWLLFPELEFGGPRMIVLVVASLLAAWLSQRAFERPVLAWRRRFRVSSAAKPAGLPACSPD